MTIVSLDGYHASDYVFGPERPLLFQLCVTPRAKGVERYQSVHEKAASVDETDDVQTAQLRGTYRFQQDLVSRPEQRSHAVPENRHLDGTPLAQHLDRHRPPSFRRAQHPTRLSWAEHTSRTWRGASSL
jgi:hypothetical protein